jgi:hypothetical protein
MNERTWAVTKTRQRKPKVTLYLNCRPVLSQVVASVVKGNRLGRAWEESTDD